jgi:large subunit ribosomal protein L11
MAKKEVVARIKLHIPAGKATPAPPIGPTLSPHGIPLPKFCNAFNDKTKDQAGMIIPTVITVYKDRSYDFILKSPLTSVLLKRAAGIVKASGVPNKEKIGKVTMDDIKKIAEIKMVDLNAEDIENAMKIIMGTAKSMGIEVVEKK